jgi:CHAT domain-containing protein
MLSFEGKNSWAHLPWELLHSGKTSDYLIPHNQTILVRYFPTNNKLERHPIAKNLRVLVAMVLPGEDDIPKLDLNGEKKRLEYIQTKYHQITFDFIYGPNSGAILGAKDIQEVDFEQQLTNKLEEGWDILHFVGHAAPDRLPPLFDEAEVVLWSEDRNGDYMPLGSRKLKQMLKKLIPEGKAPKLIVLNACETASIDSTLVHAALENGVGAVIGMQWPLLDQQASIFSETLYRTLGRIGRVDYAVSLARNRMFSQSGARRHDWAAPVLFMQTPDGLVIEKA